MRSWARKGAAAVIVLWAAAAGCRKGGEGEGAPARVVARVGDRDITAAEVYRGLYPQGKPKDAQVDTEVARHVVDQLVERALILAWAEDNDVTVATEEVKARLALVQADYGARGFSTFLKSQGFTPEDFEKAVRDDLLVEATIEAAVVEKVSVSYDDIVAYYNVHGDEFEVAAEYHLKQIVTENKTQAEESLTKLEYGATFGEVARELSVSPDRYDGGDVGYTALDALPPEVASAVEKLPRGEVSPVIETAYGFEVVKVVAVREARRRPLAEVRTEIEDLLRTAREEEVFAAWVADLRTGAKISVDEDVLAEL